MLNVDPTFRLALLALACIALVHACGGDGGTEPSQPPPDPQRPTTVAVDPAASELTALGTTAELSAEVRDQNGRAMAVTVTWSSSDTSTATVNASGLVTAAGNGTATITAAAGTVSGSATVSVTQEVRAVEVTAGAGVMLPGTTLQLDAEAQDANGHAVDGSEFVWTSSDTAVAVVDTTGLVTGIEVGEVEVSATSSGATGQAQLEVVEPVPAMIAVSPDRVRFDALGDTLRLAAEVQDQAGRPMPDEVVMWAASDSLVATVNATGLVTAVANGAATIIATSKAVSDEMAVEVMQVPRRLTVTPSAATLFLRDSLRLVAEAQDANGHAVDGSEFVWTSSDTAVAVVDTTGLVTGIEVGEVEVSATSSGATGQAQLEVVEPVPAMIAVSPDRVRFDALGDTLRLAAEVQDQAGRPMPDEVVMWAASDSLVATVNATGLVTAVANGAATIIATSKAVSDEMAVEVMQVPRRLTVTPSADTLFLGDSLRLVAEALDANEHPVAGAPLDWSSSDPSVVTVDSAGVVWGAGEGTAEITAATGMIGEAARVSVFSPDRAPLVALYEATNGGNWPERRNWESDRPLSEWFGVSVDADRRVTQVILAENELTGTIPPGLADLSNLEVLWLSRNDLTGTIPPELGDLSNLRSLALDQNALTGSIPAEIGDLSNLAELRLEGNALTGSIPPELGNLSNLERLWLGGSGLTGPIPPELGDLSNLRSLALYHNALTGSIPAEIGDLSNLAELWLEGNALTGSIPPELGNLPNLERLWLGASGLTGPIPPELGDLSNLRDLELYQNALTGSIPAELGGLPNLEVLLLSRNDLTGSIPPELGDLSNLRDLALDRNALTGSIPPELGDLSSLERLRLRENRLTGAIPARLGNLTQLVWLGLDVNDLGGGDSRATRKPLATRLASAQRQQHRGFHAGGAG